MPFKRPRWDWEDEWADDFASPVAHGYPTTAQYNPQGPGYIPQNPGQGYHCFQCNTWIPTGIVHHCPTGTVPLPDPGFQKSACPKAGKHDFVVGKTHAICNYCEKIIRVLWDEE